MSKNYAHNAKLLKNLRFWTNENLPLYGTYIGYDLAIQILENSACERQASLKNVYHSLSHSEPQLRRKLRAFENDGWIYVVKSPCDHRNCLVMPTSKMLETYDRYFMLVANLPRELRLS